MRALSFSIILSVAQRRSDDTGNRDASTTAKTGAYVVCEGTAALVDCMGPLPTPVSDNNAQGMSTYYYTWRPKHDVAHVAAY